MPGFLRHQSSSILMVALLVASGCGEDGGNDPDPTTPEELLTDGLAKIPQMGEALTRLVLTIQGTPQPGVNITPITDGVQGSVGVDLDNNGSHETTVNGSLVYVDPNVGLAGGATLTITDIDGPTDIDGNLTALVTPASATDVIINPGTGFIDSPAGDISVDGMTIVVSFGTPTLQLSGSAQFTLAGDVGLLSFGDDGQGGMILTLDYQGEITTVP
jgi:hypothetical protein